MENDDCGRVSAFDGGEIDAEILAFLDTVEILPTLTTVDVINDTKAIVPMRIEKKYIDVSDLDILFPIFWAQADYGQFYVFESNAQFLQYLNQLKPEARKFHEVVNGMRPHRIIIDVDYVGDNLDIKYIGDTMSRGIIDCFNEYYENMAIIGVDDLIIKNASNDKKFSAHYIIKEYKVQDYHEAKEFVQYLTKSVPFGDKIDMGVYATKHNFRTVGSVKESRTFRVISQHVAQDAFVTHAGDDDDCFEQLLPSMVEAQRAIAPQVQAAVNINVAEILAACRDHLVGWQYRSFTGTRVLFDRSPGEVVPECTICARTHDHDNALFLSIYGKRVYKCCFRNHNKRELIYTSGKALTKVSKITIEQIVTMMMKFKPKTIKNANCVNRLGEFDFNGNDVLTVQSPMGTGKTFQLKEYMIKNDISSAVMVSFRKTFTEEKADDLSLQSYRKWKNVSKIPTSVSRLIIQYESLHKYQREEPPKLFILDEIESILAQIYTAKTPDKTANNKNYKIIDKSQECWNKFQWLLQHSERVIVMDANLSSEAKYMIEAFRPDVCIGEITNNYLTWKDYPAYVYKTPDQIFTAVTTSQKQKFAVCSNNKKWLKSVDSELRKSRPDAKILLVCKETRKDFRCAVKEIRKNKPEKLFGECVNEYIGSFDYFLYSPTYLAGCSIETEDFKCMYAMFNNKTTPSSCMQMLGRVRAVKEFHVCLDIIPSQSLTHEEILEFMKSKHQLGALRIPESLLDFEYGKNFNELVYRHMDDPRFILLTKYITAQMQAKCKFVQEFSLMMRACGVIFHAVAVEAPNNKYTDAAKRVTAEDCQKIADAVIDVALEEQADDLATKKAILCNLYEVGPTDVTGDFVHTYGKSAIMGKFKTLKALKRWGSIEQYVRIHDMKLAGYAVKNGADAVEWQAQSNESSRVIIATDALKILNVDCGADNFEGEFVLKRAELEAHLRVVPAFVLRHSALLKVLFDIKNNRLANPAQWDFKKRLAFINGIIKSMFGIELKPTKKGEKVQDNYKLKMMVEFKYCVETTKYRPRLIKQNIEVKIEVPDGDQNMEDVLDI